MCTIAHFAHGFSTLVSRSSKIYINICTVRNTEIHPLFIENAKFLLADLYITHDNLFLYQKKITG